MKTYRIEIQSLFMILSLFFGLFLMGPLLKLLLSSLNHSAGDLWHYYKAVFQEADIMMSVWNSIKVSFFTAFIATLTGFILAYGYHCSNIKDWEKHWIDIGISLPMLLPTITYGFVIMYGLGRQGIWTKILGRQAMEIYGFGGLLLGYLIYTLPIAFLVLKDAFAYVDKKYIIISKLMGDRWYRTLYQNIIRPISGAIGGTFLLTFILSFTDFGIPASVGGTYKVIAAQLYHVMLGAVPDFARGSVIAVLMLFPSIIGIVLLNYFERFNFHYDHLSMMPMPENKGRDKVFRCLFLLIIGSIAGLFLVIFITPFVVHYPYDLTFTMAYAKKAILSNNVLSVYKNSLLVAVMTALIGSLVAYSAAVIRSRSNAYKGQKMCLDALATVTNSVPGMVLGLAYLFMFKDLSLKGTYWILILCNVVHFFTTPYLMAKNALSKMNTNYETIGQLMGDKWHETIIRVIIPNSIETLLQMLSYFLIHSMITVSAVIFLVTARTSVMTSKIKELQHYGNFNEIFILSILIFITNLVIKIAFNYINNRLSFRS